MEKEKLVDKYRGCLLGGAVASENINMLILTARGLLRAEAGFINSSRDYLEHLAISYREQGGWQQRNLYAAPVGLFFDSPKRAAQMARAIAGLNGDAVVSEFSASALAYMIELIVERPELKLLEILRNTLRDFAKMFKGEPKLESFLELMVEAVHLSKSEVSPAKAIAELAKESSQEEILAGAIYYALKYESSFEEALNTAVKYAEPCIAAVTGNILGAYLGLGAIPEKLIEPIEVKNELTVLADDLLEGYPYPKDEARTALWRIKYGARKV